MTTIWQAHDCHLRVEVREDGEWRHITNRDGTPHEESFGVHEFTLDNDFLTNGRWTPVHLMLTEGL